ncbi:ZYBA0S09-01156g1_1 [Zygosaccharomyces bailii CLIB 213]|uniref:ZYBA0S09-01156g1_1 n=1 Tax=Zygosaccharomyces bailii (strain CLIB 213 / ATCC 58445 / CBS 680 / BCRC 21525 / NBRC 1098 / NCYC 1416 / NRRL Y-2227) TaxID=1333698 RepID=A0A8J2T9H9_ZYGB2|nr:ZYBA0S09-01156g1_1 [Zygosaccharomyces bailii CLIB 213]
MGGDARQQQHVIQSGQTGQQPQQPQQLFMSPQTENLSYMYNLVDRLIEQLKKNKRKKEQLLWDVDILSKQFSRKFKKSAPPAYDDFDVVIFQKFLNQRHNSIEKKPDQSEGRKPKSDNRTDALDKLVVLRKQNEELRKVLDSKIKLNLDTFSLLNYHEDALTEIVRFLRADVLQSHELFIKKVRNKFNDEMISKEDEEFKIYLENIKEVQKLMDFSHTYRLLLRVCDQ